MSISPMEVQEAMLEAAMERLLAQRDPCVLKMGCEEGWSAFAWGMHPLLPRCLSILSPPEGRRQAFTLIAHNRVHLRGIVVVSPQGRVFQRNYGKEGRWVEVGCIAHVPCPEAKLAHLR